MKPTYQTAMAAGQDAGNRSMRRAGRRSWSDADWRIAAVTVERLLSSAPKQNRTLGKKPCLHGRRP